MAPTPVGNGLSACAKSRQRHLDDGNPQLSSLKSPSFLDIPILTEVIEETESMKNARHNPGKI
ncbi:MAG: hypothetical protein M0Q95_16245 [Porticoccaceae bacterium]|nr:hypothetical protein [Porticoccaceae bacterium]